MFSAKLNETAPSAEAEDTERTADCEPFRVCRAGAGSLIDQDQICIQSSRKCDGTPPVLLGGQRPEYAVTGRRHWR